MVQIQPTRAHTWFLKSHPREWVDGSDPTYTSTHLVLEIPPTGVGGWFRSNLHASTHRVLESHPREWVDGSDPTYQRARSAFLNPTHGSGWMVQIQPTREHAPRS